MKFGIISVIIVLITFIQNLPGQEHTGLPSVLSGDYTKAIYGFVRAGGYIDLEKHEGKPLVSSSFSDLGLKIDINTRGRFRGFADIRVRYGTEFHDPVQNIDIKECFVEFQAGKFSFSTGQKIIKWGRADFTNPVSRFNPVNYISRSPDREDMDLGNLVASADWFPSGKLNLQIVYAPFYRPSVLIIDPVPVPDYVDLRQIKGLMSGERMSSWGLKADFHIQGIDFAATWFNGYNPMPGIKLTEFNLDLSGMVPDIHTILQSSPYKINVIGFDFEAVAGITGMRGEAAWISPVRSFEIDESVPLPELVWVAGIDMSYGIWRLAAEYSGKHIYNFIPSPADPVIGTEPDISKLAEMLAIPGLNVEDYVRQQVAAFNRLYNYQLEKSYHSAGLRFEGDLLYGRFLPSLFSMYGFTSKDLLLIPEVRIKPWDGFTITAGVEFYSGAKGSLFNMVSDFMRSAFIGIKIDF